MKKQYVYKDEIAFDIIKEMNSKSEKFTGLASHIKNAVYFLIRIFKM